MNEKQIKVCVTGAAGFIAGHLCRYLQQLGYWVRAVDYVKPRYGDVACDESDWRTDLRFRPYAVRAVGGMDWVFALAADMGGAGFVFTGENDLNILRNNVLVNTNTLRAAQLAGVKQYLFSSSACVYPAHLQDQESPTWVPALQESDAYPADPDSAYGWEKLFTERLCLAYRTMMKVKIARLHNVYGPRGAWRGGREKAPAALCRKIAVAKLTGDPGIEIWGDGSAVRSYMHISDCVQGILRLMQSEHDGPLNLGRDRVLTVDELADIIADIAEVDIVKKHTSGPTGVSWRSSDNTKCRELLGWEPIIAAEVGLVPAYHDIEQHVKMWNGEL